MQLSAPKQHPPVYGLKGCVRKRDVPDLNVLVAPLVEQLDAANLLGDLLGKDGVAGGALDLNFAVRHDCDVLGATRFGGLVRVSGRDRC
jgi:hypothetical protein